MSRLPYASISPDGFQPFRTLDKYLKTSSGLESTLLHIVYLRVSQINGCPYCVDLHWRDARAEGEDERKLNGVVLWRDMPFFSQRERAALAWAEAVTRLNTTNEPFLFFQDAQRRRGSVLYHRYDGHYGLITPDG